MTFSTLSPVFILSYFVDYTEFSAVSPDVSLAGSICEAYGISADQLISGSPATLPDAPISPVPFSERFSEYRNITTLLICYFIGWFILVLYFWVLGGGGGIFYAAVVIGILFPAMTLFISVLVGLFDCLPLYRFFLLFVFGFMHMLLPYATFTLAHMNTVHRFEAPNMYSFFVGLCISAVGILFGLLIRWVSILIERYLPEVS